MPSDREQVILLRKFDGVNLLVDQAYLGPSFLALAQNWIPGTTFRLTKMPGNIAYPGGNIPGTLRVLKMIGLFAPGHNYLYAVVTPTAAGNDQLWVSVDQGAWAQVQFSGGGNVVFNNRAAIYDMAALNSVLYVGNGIPGDPILSVPIGGTATALTTITSFTDGGAAPTLSGDGGSQLLTGTYAYCWAIFDHTSNVWVNRGAGAVIAGQSDTVQTFTVNTTGDQAVTVPTPTGFPANGGVLSSQFRAHLFIAPVNLPIEFAHDHTPGGLSAAGSFVVRFITADGPPLPLRGPARVGRNFRSHRGRLWIAGDQTSANNQSAVWATYLTVPGLEQAVFNAGLFFPYNARTPRTDDIVTAIGVAATGADDPSAPFIVTTLSSTFLFFGDILDDPSAAFVKVSRTVGCINKDTMVETPVGTFYVGLQSVYVIPPGGGPPQDVGWPIRPAIIAIPVAGRPNCTAIYHKGFLKIAIVPPGALFATQQWWLDLRNGIAEVPSWWGPHNRVGVSAWATAQQDPNESDRGFMAVEGTGTIEVLHQMNSARENGGVGILVSIAQTGDLDDRKPLERKMFTRIRATLFPSAATNIIVGVAVDGGSVGPFDPMVIGSPAGAVWNVDQWNVGQWGQNVIAEGESVAPSARPRGRTGSVQLIHSEAVPIALRDLELRYLPVPRPVRSVSTDQSS